MDGSTSYGSRLGERASPVRALVLVNAGKRRSPNLATGLRRLAEAGVEIADMDLDLSALGQRRALSAARCCHRIVIGGGDGTLHRAAPLLMQARLPFGILPMGTANDLARTLGIPTDPVAAAEVIANGREQAIDLGEVNGHPYFNVASIGVSADLARNLTHDVKQRWGVAAYPLTAARVALSCRPFKATVTCNGETFATESMQIAVGNGRYYGGGLAVDERAAIDDGHLHLYSLEVKSIWRVLPMLWAFRRGTHGSWATVETRVGDSFEIETQRPMPVNADGEIITRTPAKFRVLSSALRVIAPDC